jgi:hypothetical protein
MSVDLPIKPQAAERRRFKRSTTVLTGTLFCRDEIVDCVVMNISANGAKIKLKQAPAMGETVTLLVNRYGVFTGAIAWRADESVGIQFDEDPKRVAKAIGERATPVQSSAARESTLGKA